MVPARPRLQLVGALLVAAACDVDPGAALDGRDAGGGARDAELRDGGRPDGGGPDAVGADARTIRDAGLDGSTPDAADPDPDPSGWCERDAGWPQREPAIPPFPLDGPSLGPVDTEPDLPSLTVQGALIEPPDLGFGGVTVGQTASVTVELVAVEAGTYAVASPPACPAAGPFCARFRSKVLEAGDRYVFDVAYRPTAPAGRDRASVEVTSDGTATRRIPVDGTALDRPAVDCWAPTRLDPLAPGEVTTFEVRCVNAGLGPAVLTELAIESDVPFVIEDEPLPRPTSAVPLSDGDAAWTVELRPEADAGAFETTVRWRGASAAGGPGVHVGLQTVRARVVPGRLELPASLVVPVRSRGDDALLELRNVGLGSVAIDGVEVDGPFEVAEETVPDVVRGGERKWIRVRVAPFEAALDEVRSGALRLFTDPGEEPREVTLQMDPPQAGTCQLDVPGYTDLGRVRPPEAYPAGAPTERDLELTLGVQNVGDGPCLIDVEAFGLIEGVTPLRSHEPGEAPTPSTSMWLFAGETDFLRLAPRLGLAPGKHVGRVELTPRGEPGVRAVARFGAELTSTGARVRVGAPAGGHCARLGRYTVAMAGVEVVSARWVSDTDDPVFVRGGGPGYRTRFDVDRGDDDPGLLRGTLRMQTSGGLVQVPLAFGRAAPRARRQVDRFQAPRPSEVDVLFVVDDSMSMACWHPNLARNLMDFVNFADAQRLDYRLMLTRTATGALVPLGPAGQPYLVPNDTPERRGAFVERAVGPPEAPRAAGSGIERSVEAALRAIDGARGGVLREGAVLSIVVVTDEADGSPVTLEAALDALLAAKGRRNTRLLSFSVISGGDTGCRAGPLTAAPTLRLVELARRIGGVAGRLCSPDWSRTLEDLSRTVFGFGFKSRYFLTNQPIPETVEVEVNGLRVPDACPSGRVNWTYDFSTNSVNFTPLGLPPPGADLRIEYDAGCL